ncbi:MAG: nucleotidyl transferase AbiEii/AbiGii toxin family protein [Deltaproteobacteria bacterium]|nr:nucleotidyl transferase AbiEii/AbiGii toxin family protein [Nannocystaceae bacterium]
MNQLELAITRIIADLNASRRQWALIGGLAVSARTEPRTTRDVDVAVAVADDAEAESLISELMRAGYSVHAAVEQLETGRLATMRLLPPGAARTMAIVDLLFASSGIEVDLVGRATVLEILPGLALPVATIGDLIALKVLSRDDDRRPQDAADLRALIREATEQDVALARASAAAIGQRGFNRGRDLDAMLEEVLHRFARA